MSHLLAVAGLRRARADVELSVDVRLGHRILGAAEPAATWCFGLPSG